jgi:peptidoglycan/xylan/chitin deacetylase (PgdA/CDA1 family)
MNITRTKRWLGKAWPKTSRKNSILVFHSTGSAVPASLEFPRFQSLITGVKRVARIVSLHEIVNAYQDDVRRVAVTFDDGYLDNFTNAFPFLHENDIPFTVFVTTSFVDGNADLFKWSPHYAGLPALSWSQLREMAQAGVTIGSHTVTHPRLAKCSEKALALELRDSKLRIEEKLGIQVDSIAYPFGQDHDISPEVLAATDNTGYQLGFTTLPDLIPKRILAAAIPRITVDNDDDDISLMQKLAGRRRFMVGVSKVRSAAIRLNLVDPLIPDRQFLGRE